MHHYCILFPSRREWAVVDFNQGLSIAPLKWTKSDGTSCYWKEEWSWRLVREYVDYDSTFKELPVSSLFNTEPVNSCDNVSYCPGCICLHHVFAHLFQNEPPHNNSDYVNHFNFFCATI